MVAFPRHDQEIKQYKQKSCRDLNGRILPRNTGLTMATTSTEQQVTQDWDKISRINRLVACWTFRATTHHRFPGMRAKHHDIQKAADACPQDEYDDRPKHKTLLSADTSLHAIRRCTVYSGL